MTVTLGHGNTRLVLRDPVPGGSDDPYKGATVVAELVSGDNLFARTNVFLFGFSGLGPFLGELADSWRGWKGAREWESPERHLSISATEGVKMRVTLRDSPVWTWTATADIEVEGGEELRNLARGVAELLDESIAFPRP